MGGWVRVRDRGADAKGAGDEGPEDEEGFARGNKGKCRNATKGLVGRAGSFCQRVLSSEPNKLTARRGATRSGDVRRLDGWSTDGRLMYLGAASNV